MIFALVVEPCMLDELARVGRLPLNVKAYMYCTSLHVSCHSAWGSHHEFGGQLARASIGAGHEAPTGSAGAFLVRPCSDTWHGNLQVAQ